MGRDNIRMYMHSENQKKYSFCKNVMFFIFGRVSDTSPGH